MSDAGTSGVEAANAVNWGAGGASGASGFEGSMEAGSLFGSETQATKETMLANSHRFRHMGTSIEVPYHPHPLGKSHR